MSKHFQIIFFCLNNLFLILSINVHFNSGPKWLKKSLQFLYIFSLHRYLYKYLDFFSSYLAGENDWWAEDDSDFDINSEDSEEEEDNRLCNTVMLMGPSGVGKTTTVYALAQEIGFKVSVLNFILICIPSIKLTATI